MEYAVVDKSKKTKKKDNKQEQVRIHTYVFIETFQSRILYHQSVCTTLLNTYLSS